MKNIFAFALVMFCATVHAEPQKRLILTDPELLKAVGVVPTLERVDLGVALASVTAEQEAKISEQAHDWGRCGGFESLFDSELVGDSRKTSFSSSSLDKIFSGLEYRQMKEYMGFANPAPVLTLDPAILASTEKVESERIKQWVQWFSAFPTRHHAAPTNNDHVMQLKTKVEAMLAGSSIQYTVETIDHQRTKQKSLKVRIEGSQRPNEIVVLGGHYDSINGSFMGGSKAAPGADDNASGSASLLEALRVISANGQPQRTIEFMWYAAEEVGLWGSAEIAASYKSSAKDVIGVLQLDMTMFPGDGELVIASMSDFTSAWMRGLLLELNRLYINAKIIDDKCGYGCSDHASWNRQGFPTLMPFESSMSSMNSHIHTAQDVINSQSNFTHAAAFSKIAVAIAMQLGNSTLRE
jgi:bacterial leucyl aminopeptidase